MGKKYKHLFERIITAENFQDAYRKTARGKRWSRGYLEFKEYGALNLKWLREEVADGEYRMGEYEYFLVHEPKVRSISALPFRDRIVQHAINNVLEPIFDRTFLPYTFACRTGFGTHAGVRHVQSRLRRPEVTHCLKTDFSSYFPSIDRSVLYRLIDAKVKCQRTSDLLRRIVPDTGVGIHIGNLTSQLFANLYGSMADRLIHFDLRPFAWARYMDDIVVLDRGPGRLRYMRDRLEAFARDAMGLRFSKWSVQSVQRGVNFLGYRIWPTHKLVRKDSVRRAKKKLRRFEASEDTAARERFLAAWRGHIAWADSHNLKRHLEIENAAG